MGLIADANYHGTYRTQLTALRPTPPPQPMRHRSARARLHSSPRVCAIACAAIPTPSAPVPTIQATLAPPLADPRHSRTHLPAGPEGAEEPGMAAEQHGAEALYTRPRAEAAACPPSGPPVRALWPAPRPLQASGAPQSSHSRCSRPYHPPPGSAEGSSPMNALSSSPASPRASAPGPGRRSFCSDGDRTCFPP